jgi:hypothetical protein
VIRDVCRGRTDAAQELGRTKKQLKSFLLRNGYHYQGKANWSAAHMRYLRELVMAHPSQKLILEEYIQRIDALEDNGSTAASDSDRHGPFSNGEKSGSNIFLPY